MAHVSSNQSDLAQGVVLCLCLVIASGCGPGIVPIEGTVSLDGQPLPDVQILFDQPNVPGGPCFAGRTDQEGHFTLRPVGESHDGPVAGVYRVTLTTAVAERTAIEGTPLPRERIPAEYRNGALEFELTEDGTKEADFLLTSRSR